MTHPDPTARQIRPAAISSDPATQEALAGLLAKEAVIDDQATFRVTMPMSRLNGTLLSEMDAADIGLVFVDMGPDRDAALDLTRALLARDAKRPVVLVGPSLDTELVLEGMRAGASEYLPQPLDPAAFAGAVQRLTGRGPGASRTEPGVCVGVLGGKGGSGITTIATNLSVVLANATGGKVLLVDLDELGTAGLLLGVWPRYSFHDVLENFHRLDPELLSSMVERHESGVDLLASPSEKVHEDGLPGDQARKLLRFAKTQYDFVVVDLGRNVSRGFTAMIPELDQAVVVVTPELPSVRNTKRVISMVEPLFQGKPEDLHVVMNGETGRSNITQAEAAETLGHPISWGIPNEESAWRHAADLGRPLVLGAGSTKSARQLRALGTRIAGDAARRPETPRGLKRLGALVRRNRA